MGVRVGGILTQVHLPCGYHSLSSQYMTLESSGTRPHDHAACSRSHGTEAYGLGGSAGGASGLLNLPLYLLQLEIPSKSLSTPSEAKEAQQLTLDHYFSYWYLKAPEATNK